MNFTLRDPKTNWKYLAIVAVFALIAVGGILLLRPIWMLSTDPGWNNNSYKTVWFMGVKMKIVDEATLFTNKLVALSNRKAPVSRDLFDAYYFLNLRFPINEALIQERTGKTRKEYLEFLIPFIQKHYNQKNILQGLGQSLDEDQKRWAKENLIEETIKLIKSEF